MQENLNLYHLQLSVIKINIWPPISVHPLSMIKLAFTVISVTNFFNDVHLFQKWLSTLQGLLFMFRPHVTSKWVFGIDPTQLTFLVIT